MFQETIHIQLNQFIDQVTKQPVDKCVTWPPSSLVPYSMTAKIQ